MAKRLADFPLWTVSGGGRLTECRSRGVTLITWSFPMRVQSTCNNRTCVRRWLATWLTRFANDGAALGRNPPDGKRAADVRAHAFAERQHMPLIRQGLKRGSVAGPSPVRIALERDLTLGVCRCLAQEGELFCRHCSAPNRGRLPGNALPEKRSGRSGTAVRVWQPCARSRATQAWSRWP